MAQELVKCGVLTEMALLIHAAEIFQVLKRHFISYPKRRTGLGSRVYLLLFVEWIDAKIFSFDVRACP